MPNPAFPTLGPDVLAPPSIRTLMIQCVRCHALASASSGVAPAQLHRACQLMLLPCVQLMPPVHRCLADDPRLRCTATQIRQTLGAHLNALLSAPPPPPPGLGSATLLNV